MMYEMLYEILADRLGGMSLIEFSKAISKFELIPVTVGVVTAGVILVKGSEMHVAIKPEYRGKWFSRKVAKLMRDILQQHGHITTKVMESHDMGHSFARRLGFHETARHDGIVEYEALQ